MTTTTFLQRVPKIQLHCHLEGTLRAATFLELTDRYGFSTRYRPGAPPEAQPHDVRDPQRVYRFADFPEFLMLFAAVSRALKTPDDYARLAREYAEDASAQNVRYAELHISPPVWQFFHPELSVAECIDAMNDALRDAPLDVRFIYDLTRNFGADAAVRNVRFIEELGDDSILGIGLGGDERRFPPALFGDAYAYAKSIGLHRVVHAGEAAGPESVRDAIAILGAERIGHGVRALEDPALVSEIAEREIALECCPTSNVLTGATLADELHQLFELDRHGVRVTVDSDDPALFSASVTDEYAYVLRKSDATTLARFVANAVDASFAPEQTKRRLYDLLGEAGAEAVAGRRR